MKRRIYNSLAFVLAAGLMAEFAPAQMETPREPIQAAQSGFSVSTAVVKQRIHVKVGDQLFFKTPSTLARVYVDSPDIIQAYAASTNQVVISGKHVGTANLTLWDDQGAETAYSIVVDTDVSRLQDAYASQFPLDRIDVTADGENIILSGYVLSKDEYESAAKLAAGYSKSVANSLRIAPAHAQQVRLQVRFVEIDRNKMNQFGFNFLSLGKNIGMSGTGQFSSFGPSGLQASSNGGATSSAASAITNPLNLLIFNQGLNIGAALEDMEAHNVMQILAEPTISALSGHKATFLTGGQFPFPMVQGGGVGGAAAVTVQFMPYGVSLTFIPVVIEDGTIRLHVAPEVSALDYTNEVQIDGYTIPAISTRKAETDVELHDGQTFALTGLLDKRVTDQLQRMPGISSIPILGAFLKSRNTQKSDTELLVIITPHLDNQLTAPGTQPADPVTSRPYLDPSQFDLELNKKKR